METPSSTRRITRSQALAAANNNNMSRKFEETENGLSKSRQRTGKQQDRSALIDITNDSPIVGLAMGNLDTPSSTYSKKRFNISSKHNTTPGSGEALLRGQVKTLLQKVEEEAVLSKIPVEYRQFLNHHGIVSSPMALLAAPTPANTPQVSDLSGNGSSINDVLALATASPIEEQFKFSQMINDMVEGTRQESAESEKNLITRSLLLDFSEKTEDSVSSDSTSMLTYQGECVSEGSKEDSVSSECTSVLTYQGECVSEGSKEKKSSADDDDASIWSIQVNACISDEEEEEHREAEDFDLEYEEEDKEEDYVAGEYYEGTDEEEDGGLLVDELCEGISNISVNGGVGEQRIAEFAGKHKRFLYNSDDEFEGVAIEVADEASASGILRLKGLPTPKGKHLRFREEDED